MAKFKLNIEETRTLHHEIVVEAEDEIDIMIALSLTGDNIEATNIKEFDEYLENNEIKVLELAEDKQGESILDCDEIERVE